MIFNIYYTVIYEEVIGQEEGVDCDSVDSIGQV